ncbi:MAG TPA: SDR family oxidoreductase [bacterium]|nr:SDR family oxidoreductase [bacterium]
MSPSSVALITGANSGFGLATAESLARRGWRVYAGYRNPRRAGALWSLARTLPVFPIVMDVDRTPSVEKGVRQILKKEGRIDFLLNNAGFVMAGCWEDLSEKDIRAQFETNVFGILRVARAVVPVMRRQGGGRILNVGSISAFIGTPLIGAYAASKFAVNSLTEAMRMELREWGVQVAELNPGEIRTQVVANARMGQWVKNPKSAYRGITERSERWQRERFIHAAPVELFTRTVLQALSHRTMKRRYLVKFEDRVAYTMRWLLPDALWEWGLTRMFTWSRWPK